jgi:carbonic anhydrase
MSFKSIFAFALLFLLPLFYLQSNEPSHEENHDAHEAASEHEPDSAEHQTSSSGNLEIKEIKIAFEKLQAGNERFFAGNSVHPRLDDGVRYNTSTEGQKPFATIMACSDSRVPVEILFDQGIGDLFVIKVAGNVSDVDEIGSIEYGVAHLGTPLMVVLGHSSCGAVTAVTMKDHVHGNIPALVDNIEPAVRKAKSKYSHLKGKEVVPYAIEENVWQSISDLFHFSKDARELVKTGKLAVVGAVYDIESGKVRWLGEHPQQAELISHGKDKKDGPADMNKFEVPAIEKGFFSTPGMVYMGIFVIVVALLAGGLIFIFIRK